MTSRSTLLDSGLRLLIQDQTRITAAFGDWKEEAISPRNSVSSLLGTVYERLQLDLDRLRRLADSYDVEYVAGEKNRKSVAPSSDSKESVAPNSLVPPGTPTVAEILQKGHEALERLSTRYASVYCMATAIMEPAVADVAYSNLKGTRDLASDLMGTRALVTVEEMTAAHPSLVVNVTAGSRAMELMRTLWAPHDDGKAEPSHAALERNDSRSAV